MDETAAVEEKDRWNNILRTFWSKMRNLKKMIYLLFIFQLLVLGCNNKLSNEGLSNSQDTIKKDTLEVQSSSTNVIDEKTISPYKEVDSLVQLLNKDFAFSTVKRLDHICLNSDGDLAEVLGDVTVDLLNNNIRGFSEYLQHNPKSCLKVKLIEGLSVKYSMYEKSERSRKLLEERDRLISIAKKEKMGEGKMEFIRELFKMLNPDLLD